MSNNKLIGKKSLFSENIKKILKKKKTCKGGCSVVSDSLPPYGL